MSIDIKEFGKTINKKHAFGFTPKYEKTVRTQLPPSVFSYVANDVFEELEWNVVYNEDNKLEAKHFGKGIGSKTHKIFVEYEAGKVKVRSESTDGEMMDWGRNSVRVKLFIHIFEQAEKRYSTSIALAELEAKVKREENMDDYIVPDSLPQPTVTRKPEFWIIALGGLAISILLGFTTGFLTSEEVYIPIIFEVGVGFLLAYTLKYLMRYANYTHLIHLGVVLAGGVIITYTVNHLMQYQIYLIKYCNDPDGILDFTIFSIVNGFGTGTENYGVAALIIVWLLQSVVTFIAAYFWLLQYLIAFQLEKVPVEVFEFTIYQIVKGKTLDEVKAELTKMGWDSEQQQMDIFEAIDSYNAAREWQR